MKKKYAFLYEKSLDQIECTLLQLYSKIFQKFVDNIYYFGKKLIRISGEGWSKDLKI